jgi:hypothetical protein
MSLELAVDKVWNTTCNREKALEGSGGGSEAAARGLESAGARDDTISTKYAMAIEVGPMCPFVSS